MRATLRVSLRVIIPFRRYRVCHFGGSVRSIYVVMPLQFQQLSQQRRDPRDLLGVMVKDPVRRSPLITVEYKVHRSMLHVYRITHNCHDRIALRATPDAHGHSRGVQRRERHEGAYIPRGSQRRRIRVTYVCACVRTCTCTHTRTCVCNKCTQMRYTYKATRIRRGRDDTSVCCSDVLLAADTSPIPVFTSSEGCHVCEKECPHRITIRLALVPAHALH